MLLVAKLPSGNRGQLQTSCLCLFDLWTRHNMNSQPNKFHLCLTLFRKNESWASQTLHIQQCVLGINLLIVFYWKPRCKTSPRYDISPERSRTEMPEGIFHCLKIFSLYSQTAQHSISMDLNFIMVQLVTLYYAVTQNSPVCKTRHKGQLFCHRPEQWGSTFHKSEFSHQWCISPTQICNVDSVTILQDTKILVSMTTGTIH